VAKKAHTYKIDLEWTGNKGTGTSAYNAYDRTGVARVQGKADIAVSADPAFRGDASKWNPEDLLVVSLATCHKLWYLHLCAMAKIVVVDYRDAAEGVMEEEGGMTGQFVSVTLKPTITVQAGADLEKAKALHAEAHDRCFIARSVNFPVGCEPTIKTA
jgi:organic hydroperoxide reductase OsmC/OhrA